MSGDLSIVKFRGKPPTRRSEMREEALLPLGTLREIKAILERHIPAIEWEIEPSLLSILQQSGSNLWREWDAETLAAVSVPKLVGQCHNDSLSLRFYSLPTDEEANVSSLLVEMHSVGNPYVTLQTLCEANGWIAIGPNPEDEPVDFSQAIAEWEDWEQNEDRYLEAASIGREEREHEIADFNRECHQCLMSLNEAGGSCPRCDERHNNWRCIVPDDPSRRAYFVCGACGRSVQREQFPY
jgi:hypothetical protein